MLVSNELESETVSAAIVAADRAGSRVVLNPAPARPLAAGVLARLSLLTPNEPEVQALAGITDVIAAARSLAAETHGPVIVTRGAAGASIVSEDAVVHVPAPECAPVDTVGAGDVFNGVLAARLVGEMASARPPRRRSSRASESTRWLGRVHRRSRDRSCRFVAVRRVPRRAGVSKPGCLGDGGCPCGMWLAHWARAGIWHLQPRFGTAAGRARGARCVGGGRSARGPAVRGGAVPN